MIKSGEIAKSKLNFQQALNGVDEALTHYGISLGPSGAAVLEERRQMIKVELDNFDVDWHPWFFEKGIDL